MPPCPKCGLSRSVHRTVSPASRSVSLSIAAGSVTSILGPSRSVTTPLSADDRPSKVSGPNPAATKRDRSLLRQSQRHVAQPMIAEIDPNPTPGAADMPYPARHDRKPTLLLRYRRRVRRIGNCIVRIGPKAKTCPAGRAFCREECCVAGTIAWRGTDAPAPLREHAFRQGEAFDDEVAAQYAVAIRLSARQKRRFTPGDIGQGQRGLLDAGEAQPPAIRKDDFVLGGGCRADAHGLAVAGLRRAAVEGSRGTCNRQNESEAGQTGCPSCRNGRLSLHADQQGNPSIRQILRARWAEMGRKAAGFSAAQGFGILPKNWAGAVSQLCATKRQSAIFRSVYSLLTSSVRLGTGIDKTGQDLACRQGGADRTKRRPRRGGFSGGRNQ